MKRDKASIRWELGHGLITCADHGRFTPQNPAQTIIRCITHPMLRGLFAHRLFDGLDSRWTLTHGPSGMMVIAGLSKPELRRAVPLLAGIDWTLDGKTLLQGTQAGKAVRRLKAEVR